MSLTKPRYSGTITFDDGIRPPIKRGTVLIGGSSPRAKVSIIDFDVSDAGSQNDVMQNVKVAEDETTGKIRLVGESLYLIRQMHLTGSDVILTVEVDVKNCKNCPG